MGFTGWHRCGLALLHLTPSLMDTTLNSVASLLGSFDMGSASPTALATCEVPQPHLNPRPPLASFCRDSSSLAGSLDTWGPLKSKD